MNSRERLLRYLETNSNLNVTKNIYGNYKESFINRKKITGKDKKSINDFVKHYLSYICKSLENIKANNAVQYELKNCIEYCLEAANLEKSFTEIPYFSYDCEIKKIKNVESIKESDEYLRQLLITLTRNYQTTLTRTFLLLNMTDCNYIERFVRFIISSLKNNKNTEVTYLYLNAVSNFYLRNETDEMRKNRIKSEAIENITEQRRNEGFVYEEWGEEDWLAPRIYDRVSHAICKDFNTSKDLKELFLTLTLNYKGIFSQNTRYILNTSQTCTFKIIYEQISLISNSREHEYIRQVFESILRYLENNISVDVEKVWVANILLENVSGTDIIRQGSSKRKQSKSFSNLIITLGFSEEIEEIENNDLLEFFDSEPFYIPIYYRKHVFVGDF